MSTKSFDILYLCRTGWCWVGRAQFSSRVDVFIWDKCSVTCRQGKGQHPFLHEAETVVFAGKGALGISS